MALKRRITKDEHGKLAKELQGQYKAEGEEFVLETEGDEDVAGLKSSLTKERDNVKEFKRQLKELQEQAEAWANLDLTQVKALMERFENDDEGKLIKAGKIDEVIAKRTEKLRAELEKKIAAEAAKVKAADERAAKYQQRVLDNAIRAAAAKVGVHANAVEDALRRGRELFTLTEEGEAVQLDDTKHPKIGKDGKTPFSPAEWLEGMKETAPHWFPAGSTGAGARGDGGAGGAKRTLKRAEFDKLDPVAKATTAAAMRKGEVAVVD